MNKTTVVILALVLWILGIIFCFILCRICKITLLRSTFIQLITPPEPKLEDTRTHRIAQLQISNEV